MSSNGTAKGKLSKAGRIRVRTGMVNSRFDG